MREIALSELNVEKTGVTYLEYWKENTKKGCVNAEFLDFRKKIAKEYEKQFETAINEKVNYYENSRSWRYTKPLRDIMKLMKGTLD
jgi:hypothetical protein